MVAFSVSAGLRSGLIVAQLLIPIRARKRVRLPVTLATILVPLVGLFIILNVAPVRSPLTEAEAPLALAARYPDRTLLENAALPPVTATSVALVSIAPRLVGTSEFELRILGLFAGIAALALMVRLGERLFSTRVGIVAALLLFATPAGRSLLGTQLSIEPFYLITTFAALGATRGLAGSRSSGVYAGIAIGVAVALVGPRALWLAGVVGFWLWRLRGLNLRSALTVSCVVAFSAFATALLSAALLVVLRPGPLPPLLLWPFEASVPWDLQVLLLGLLFTTPIAPLAVLGALHRPASWRLSGSPRFLGIWLTFGLLEFVFSGHWAGLYTALCFAVAVPTVWAIENAPRRAAILALAGSAALAMALITLAPENSERRLQERWAARETGRFVRRTVPVGSTLLASDDLRGRIAYYARRTTRPALDGVKSSAVHWEIVPRSAFATSGTDLPLPRTLRVEGEETRILAEIGPYVLSRVGTPPAPATEPTSAESEARTALIGDRHSGNAVTEHE
jgi:hypothetical protein